MRDFFNGWRRNVACVALGFACVFMLQGIKRTVMPPDRMVWQGVYPHPSSGAIERGDEWSQATEVPMWLPTVSLILLSASLILWQPGEPTRGSSTQTPVSTFGRAARWILVMVWCGLCVVELRSQSRPSSIHSIRSILDNPKSVDHSIGILESGMSNSIVTREVCERIVSSEQYDGYLRAHCLMLLWKARSAKDRAAVGVDLRDLLDEGWLDSRWLNPDRASMGVSMENRNSRSPRHTLLVTLDSPFQGKASIRFRVHNTTRREFTEYVAELQTGKRPSKALLVSEFSLFPVAQSQAK